MRVLHRRGRVVAVAASLSIGVLLAGCTGQSDDPAPVDTTSPLPAEITEQLTAAAERGMQAGGAPGAIIGVNVPWAGEWVAGLGETAPGSGEQPAADMTFRVGDVTRSMTCDVLYGLDAAGRVSLQDDVTGYIPSIPQLDGVTLVELCDSTAGIAPSQPERWSQILSNRDRVWGPREFVAAGLGKDRQETGVWNDSDTSYFLLGLAMENATRTSMAELYTQYVTEPLGLAETTLPSRAAAEPGSTPIPGFYTPYAQREENCEAEPSEVTELSSSLGYANGGVVSTVPDLLRYTAAVAGEAGDAEDLGPRWSDSLPTTSDGDQWVRYAGGNLLYGPMIGQAGDILGYSVAAFSDVETGLTVSIMLNNSAGGDQLAGAIARELAAIAAETPGDAEREIGLPWTIDQAHGAVGEAAVCPIAE